MSRASTTGEGAALSSDLANFLIELSIGLHKNATYPPGHPLLDGATAGIIKRLDALLKERSTLSLGVARHQLIIEGVATDDTNPVLRDLAIRLHRHHLGAVKFTQGVDSREIAAMLATVAVAVGRRERPIGMEGADFLGQWPHIRLLPMTFEQLQLLDEEPAEGEAEDVSGTELRGAKSRAAVLWIGLARAALASESAGSNLPTDEVATDPMVVAKAINENKKDVAYDQVVVGYMLQIADELKLKKEGSEALALRRRISQLVSGLDEETRRRVLTMGGDALQRRKFMIDAADGMTVEAVMELLKAAADTSHQNISHSMFRMLSKLAMNAEGGVVHARSHADVELREQVTRLVKDWDLDDPNPDSYRLALQRMSADQSMFTGIDQYPCEPERLLAMGFEIELLGEPVWRAVDQMLERPDFAPLLDFLDAAPPGWLREALWHYVASPERLHAVLSRTPVNFGLVHRLVARMRLASVDPLLDAIEALDERTASSLVDILAGLGDDVGGFVAARLASTRWSLLRTYLAIIGRLSVWPAGFTPRDYARHPDTSVRREALRMLMKAPATRDEAISQAVADIDDRVVRLALGAAMNNCPPAAARLLMVRTRDDTLAPDLRSLGVRVLASYKSPETVQWLAERTLGKKRIFFRRPLATKTPEMLAALSGLAAHWRDDPLAQSVIALARKSTDPEVARAVAQAGGDA
ncbi:MAG TPA: hypothetical protein VJR92_06405 [Gemmatimonadaceae bacterium]|nr:hypothetical protein [Gemmatimonadaceae bacterium]